MLLHNQSDVRNPLFFTLFACTAECFSSGRFIDSSEFLGIQFIWNISLPDFLALITDGRSKICKFLSGNEATLPRKRKNVRNISRHESDADNNKDKL